MATSLGLVVPVLADSGALNRPIGRVAIAGASAGEVAAVVLLSVGLSGGDTPLAGRILLLVLLLAGLVVIGLAVTGVENSMRLSAMFVRLADTSAQIRVRWTVLLVAGLALAAQVLGFEAILGAFLAGMLVRALDPDPEHTTRCTRSSSRPSSSAPTWSGVPQPPLPRRTTMALLATPNEPPAVATSELITA